MNRNKKYLGLTLGLVLGIAVFSSASLAGPITFNFTGVTDVTITDGTHTIASGTPFSGTFSYDSGQAGTITPFQGGTQSVFTFNILTLTIAGQTVTEGAGSLGLYNNVTTSPSGVPNGDSLFTFVPGIPNNTPGPSSGSINGITPNFIYLGFDDSTGNAFSGPGLPSTLNLAQFSQALLGFNYGPLGAGDIDTVHPLSTLTGSAVPDSGNTLLLALGSCTALLLLHLRQRHQNRPRWARRQVERLSGATRARQIVTEAGFCRKN
jgi:hypothetical protein